MSAEVGTGTRLVIVADMAELCTHRLCQPHRAVDGWVGEKMYDTYAR